MDSQAARELNQALNHLTEKVAVLSERMTMLQPVLDDQKTLLSSQTAGLVDLANRMTRTEDRLTDVTGDLKDHQASLQKQFEEREAAFRWVLGTCIALAALLMPLMLYIIPHLKWVPEGK